MCSTDYPLASMYDECVLLSYFYIQFVTPCNYITLSRL